MNLNRLCLADPVSPVRRLLLDRGVPPPVEMDHVVCPGEVQSGSCCLERKKKHGYSAILKAVNHGLPPWDWRPTVKQLALNLPRVKVAFKQLCHSDVLSED